MAVLRTAVDGTAREAVAGVSLSPLRGDLDRVWEAPLAPALRKGELVLLMTGGVCVLDGGLEGRLIDGLSHEEKKSSPSEGADSAGVEMMMSLTTTSSGNLWHVRSETRVAEDHILTLWHLLLLSFSAHPCIWWPHLRYISSLGPCWKGQRCLRATESILWPTRCPLPSLSVADPIAILSSDRQYLAASAWKEYHTVKVGRSDKGDVYPQVAMVGGAVQT